MRPYRRNVAYAANTIGSSDIINGQVKSPDIGTGQVQSVDVRDDTLANGGLGSADIANNTVASGDIENGGVGGVDIANGDLNDEDVGQAAFVDFAADVGSVAAHDCDFDQITGVGAAKGDHLLLTGSGVDTHPSLTYAVQYQLSGGAAWVQAWQPDRRSGQRRHQPLQPAHH